FDARVNAGVFDILWDYSLAALPADDEEVPDDWYKPYADITRHAVPINLPFPSNGSIHLVSARRRVEGYTKALRMLDSDTFIERLEGDRFLQAVKANMLANFEFILVDARTGVGDVARISTLFLPDAVVNCFTLNHQGVEGAEVLTHLVHRSNPEL